MSFRRRRMTQPVKSIKHVVDTNGSIGGTASTTAVITTVDTPVRSSPNNVANASRVNAIFLRVEVIQEVAAAGIDNIYMIVFKNPGSSIGAPAVDNVGTSDNRKWIIHQEMIMTGSVLTAANAIPRTLFKGVIMLPRPYRRFGIDDELQVVIGHRTGESTQRTNFCLQCIYKEFR